MVLQRLSSCRQYRTDSSRVRPSLVYVTIPSSATRGRHRGQLSSEDEEGELLPAGDVRRAWLLALEDPQLMPQEQDFELFVMLASTTKPDEVEQERERLGEKKEQHAD